MSTISVTGKGSIHVVPDVTRLETTVTGWFQTYEEAYAQAKENSTWFVKILELLLSAKTFHSIRN